MSPPEHPTVNGHLPIREKPAVDLTVRQAHRPRRVNPEEQDLRAKLPECRHRLPTGSLAFLRSPDQTDHRAIAAVVDPREAAVVLVAVEELREEAVLVEVVQEEAVAGDDKQNRFSPSD